MRLPSLKSSLAATVLVALLAAGCGDDDDSDDADSATDTTEADDTTTTGDDSAEGDVAAYCDAILAIETVEDPDIDFETASEEEIAEGVRAFAREELRPLADEAVANAPEEVADDLAALDEALAEVEETGDFGVFDSPEVKEAEQRAHAFDVDNCGWTAVDVTAQDYSFEDLPEELDAGVTSFELTNEGSELHELVLFRKNEGVTESVEELLELTEEEAMTKVTVISGGAFAEPGGWDYMVADLEPGDYGAVCFIPVGTTSEEAEPAEDSPPHFTQGMVAEFSVS